MELKSELKEALIKIDFVERAKKLSEEYPSNRKNSFERYDNKQVINIFDKIGYNVKYNRGENFFKIIQKINSYKFKFHISLKYGLVELIWYVTKEDEFYGGSVWPVIICELERHDELIRKPQFNNYVELEEILKIACQMFEEFKDELCNVN